MFAILGGISPVKEFLERLSPLRDFRSPI